MIITDQASYSDQIFGLFWLLGYQFSPRPAGLPDQRFWRLDPHADYGSLDRLARHRINTGADHRAVGGHPARRRSLAVHRHRSRLRAAARPARPADTPAASGARSPSSAGSPRRSTCSPGSTARSSAARPASGSTATKAATPSPGSSSTATKASCASPTATAKKTSSARSASRSTHSCSGTPNTSTTRSPTYAPPATRSPTRTSGGSRRFSTSTSRCSATSPSPCPTTSSPAHAASYASSARPLSVRSCSVTTGRPITSAGWVASIARLRLCPAARPYWGSDHKSAESNAKR